MTIAYDAKRITHNATGLGNYGRMMIEALARFAPANRYLLYSPDPGRDDLRRRLPQMPQIEFRYPQRQRKGIGKAWWRTFDIRHELPAEVSLFHGLAAELPFGLRKSGVRSVVTIHDLIFLRFPSYYKWIDRKIYTYKYRKACQQADRIIAISEATKRDIVAYFGIAPEKIDVVYQGCDESFKREVAEETQRAVREKYNLPERYILYVGSIERRKNLLLLVQAAARTAEPVHIVAIGKRTPYTTEVERYAAQNGLTAAHLRPGGVRRTARLLPHGRPLRLSVAVRGLRHSDDRGGVLRRADHRRYGIVSGRSGRAGCGIRRSG